MAIENPRWSKLWLYWVWHGVGAYKNQFEVNLQQCMYGADRDKWSKIVTNDCRLPLLAKVCDRTHAHEHWAKARRLAGRRRQTILRPKRRRGVRNVVNTDGRSWGRSAQTLSGDVGGRRAPRMRTSERCHQRLLNLRE